MNIFIKYCKICKRAFDIGEGDVCYSCLNKKKGVKDGQRKL